MIYDIKDIKRIRKQLGITQTELARFSQVSQSLIAKIEADRIDPTYTRVQKIFAALEQLEKKSHVTAEKIMSKRIISLGSSASIKEAISTMRKHQISQLPVVDGQNLVGIVSETDILDALVDHKGEQLKDIMSDAPPVVSKQTSSEMLSGMLRHFPMVVVQEKGKLAGIITKSDVLSKAYR